MKIPTFPYMIPTFFPFRRIRNPTALRRGFIIPSLIK